MAAATANYDFSLTDESVVDHGSYLVIRGRASNFDVDRVNDQVTRQAMAKALERYMVNPIMLYGHNFNRPAGIVTKAFVNHAGLWIEAKLPKPSDPENLTWYNLVRDKILRALSIGGVWKRELVDGVNRLTNIDLREISLAAVGVNADTGLFSMQMAKAFGDGDDRAAVVAGMREVARAAGAGGGDQARLLAMARQAQWQCAVAGAEHVAARGRLF